MKCRSLTHLHQDIWRCALLYPWYFFGIVAVVYFPFDYVSQLILLATDTGFWASMKSSYRLYQVIDFFVGSFVVAIHCEVVRRIAKKEPVEFKSVLGGAARLYKKILELTILASIQVGLRFLLLIVPGVIKAVKLSMVFPVYIFEEGGLKEVLVKSEQYMKGHCARFFGYGLTFFSVYMLGFLGWIFFLPSNASPLVAAMYDIPYNLMTSLWTIGLCLFYADIKGDLDLARPIGTPDPNRADYDQSGADRPSKKSFVIAMMVSMVLLVSGFIHVMQLPYFDAKRMYFGEAQHQLYYDETVPLDLMEKVKGVCLQNEMFQSLDFVWLLLLEKSAEGYNLNIVADEKYWDDSEVIPKLVLLQESLSSEIVDVSVQLLLFDDLSEKKISVQSQMQQMQLREQRKVDQEAETQKYLNDQYLSEPMDTTKPGVELQD